MVPRPKVKLGEETGAVELVEKLVDDGDRERILDGEGVQGAVVDAKSPRAVSLLDEQDRGGEGRVAAADYALLDHRGALAFQFILVRRRVAVWPDGDGSGAGLEDDGVIAASRRREARRLAEDVLVRDQELVQERPTGRGEGAQLRCRCRGHPRPGEGSAAVLECHRTGGEIPHDGP
jgi:hypothetical protein